jgi:hypothetical protein
MITVQYLTAVIHDSAELAGSEEMAAIDAFNDRLQAKGTGSSPTGSADSCPPAGGR